MEIPCGRNRYPQPVSFDLRTPILLGESGAHVVRVKRTDGTSWIEKSGPATEIAQEIAVLRWCTGLLPVARVLYEGSGVLHMSDLPGVPLTDLAVELAGSLLAEALRQIHAVPAAECPFVADWNLRIRDAEERLQAGLIDESDFDETNPGRSAEDILKELQAFPPLPKLRCFTHGDASLENFLAQEGRLSGMVDLGRAGVTHPAQDWALALRGMRDHFGLRGEQQFLRHLPPDCAEESLLRRFRLLDEMF